MVGSKCRGNIPLSMAILPPKVFFRFTVNVFDKNTLNYDTPWIGSMSYNTIQVVKFKHYINLGILLASHFFYK
jgi:hypothetical protein